VLYVDRNGNGDLSEIGEKLERFVPKKGEATKDFENVVLFRTGLLAPNAAQSSRRYSDLLLIFIDSHVLMVLEHPDWPQVVGGALQFAGSPKGAPIIDAERSNLTAPCGSQGSTRAAERSSLCRCRIGATNPLPRPPSRCPSRTRSRPTSEAIRA